VLLGDVPEHMRDPCGPTTPPGSTDDKVIAKASKTTFTDPAFKTSSILSQSHEKLQKAEPNHRAEF
jgi:hypothetical protein